MADPSGAASNKKALVSLGSSPPSLPPSSTYRRYLASSIVQCRCRAAFPRPLISAGLYPHGSIRSWTHRGLRRFFQWRADDSSFHAHRHLRNSAFESRRGPSEYFEVQAISLFRSAASFDPSGLPRDVLAKAPLGGGATRELLDDVIDADWNKDGSELAVARRVGNRFRLEYPAGKVLYETTGYVSDVRFSAAGDQIAFLDHGIFGDDRGTVSSLSTWRLGIVAC